MKVFKIKFLLVLTSFFLQYNADSQPLAAFHDYRNYFMVFDNGQTVQLEHLPVQSYQVGKNCMAYVDNSGVFKVYHNGDSHILTEILISQYYVTRNLIAYFLHNQLYVYDQGKIYLLSSNVSKFTVGDSLVSFYNENKKAFYAYYNGDVSEIEGSLVGSPITNFKAGNNTFAYFNDNSKYFKVFYHGNLYDVLQTYESVRFEAGTNLVAFVDEAMGSFHVFYKGEVFDLEDFQPKSFKVGDDVLAYVNNLGEFKAFSSGELYSISSFEPDLYDVKDSLVVFSEQDYFKVFFKDETYELESYMPENFQIQESTIAYISINGWLKAFIDGELVTVTKDLIKMFSVSYDLISVNTTVNTVKVYYKGELKATN